MDWEDTEEQAAFRTEVRTLIEQRLPEWYRERVRVGIEHGPEGGWVADRASGDPERTQAANEWTEALSERGWFAPHWPKEYGGGGPERDGAVHLQAGGRRGRRARRRRAGREHARPHDHRARQRRAEGGLPCPASSPARFSGRRATPSRAPARTSPRCPRAPRATATST